MLTTAVFGLVQRFYHAIEIANVANRAVLALVRLSNQHKGNCFG